MIWPPTFPTIGLRAQGSPESWAILSGDAIYRYVLGRQWSDTGACILWVMLNPSKADHETDDATLRRVVGYSRAWGFGRCVVANAFAYRATDPRDLWRASDPAGPLNAEVLRRLLAPHPEVPEVLFAWGKMPKRWTVVTEEIERMAKEARRTPMCLSVNGDGSPRHPLRLGKTIARIPLVDALMNRVRAQHGQEVRA